MSHHWGCDSNHGRPCNCFKRTMPDHETKRHTEHVPGGVWDIVHLLQERCLSADIRIAELGETVKDLVAVSGDLLGQINELRGAGAVADRHISECSARAEHCENQLTALTADINI